MQKIFLKWLCRLDEKKISKTKFQSELFDEIFRGGSYCQLVWFQKTLKYLSMTEMHQPSQIRIAALGNQPFFSVSFLFFIL